MIAFMPDQLFADKETNRTLGRYVLLYTVWFTACKRVVEHSRELDDDAH